MSITFRPAVRESVSLIIGLVGPSGGGKTKTALRLATGMAGDKPFCFIDTEAGRALHYADEHRFDHGELKAPFRPEAYAEAIGAADKAGYPVIVVDSFSHEHAGEGGLLDWHEEEFARMGHRDAVKMTAWIKPKMAHKQMVQRLLQVRAHLILCFRAEQKIEMVKVRDPETGKMKTEIVPMRTLSGFSEWIPISEKNLLFELTASFLLTPDKPGFPLPIKVEGKHRPLFPLDQPITEESGRLLAEWAHGERAGAAIVVSAPESAAPESTGGPQLTMPNGLPSELVDRAVLKGKITGAADKAGMPAATRAALAKKLLGGGTIDTADISAVQDLLTAVRAWQAPAR